jgi:hypothetical protein
MFERTDTDNITAPRIALNETGSIGFDSSNKIELGTYVRDVGKTFTLSDPITTGVVFTVNVLESTTLNAELSAFNINYTIKRGDNIRTGIINVATDTPSNTVTYNDTYTENASTGVTLAVTQAVASTTVSIDYTITSGPTINATISYSIVRLY